VRLALVCDYFGIVLAHILAFALLQQNSAAVRAIFEQGFERRREKYGLYDARTAQAARDLGMFLARHGEEADARKVLEQTVGIDERLFGANDARTLADVGELASVTPENEAEPLWKRAAESTDATVAANALAELGRIRAAAGDRAGAAALYRRALTKEKDNATIALDLNALSKIVEPPEAIQALERALAINRRVLGTMHAETATTEANLAGLLADTPRNAEAIRLASEALNVFEHTVGRDHPRTAVAASILGYAYEVKGDRAQAERMYRLALEIDQRIYGPRHPQTLNDARVLDEFLKAPH
jgi:tetratricopeptide (TPR) repeat protein